MMRISRVGDFSLQWGESVRWDDRRRRLYFVDCATQTLHGKIARYTSRGLQDAGALMVVDGSGFHGRPEPRFHL